MYLVLGERRGNIKNQFPFTSSVVFHHYAFAMAMIFLSGNYEGCVGGGVIDENGI